MSDSDKISRRGFFLGDFLRRSGPSAPAESLMRYPKTLHDVGAPAQRTIPILRPPGAVNESDFLDQCTRCGDCISACPHDALFEAPARFRAAAGTPMFDPVVQACLMCDEMPCISACGPAVLTHDAGSRMGTAWIDQQTCLAYQGTFCSVCDERCPVEGAIHVENGRPQIDEATCTGCGVCHYVCPAPENAIAIMPTFVRPSVSRPTPSEP